MHCADARLHHTLIKFNCESRQLANRHLRLPARGRVTRQGRSGRFFVFFYVRWEQEIRGACADLLPGDDSEVQSLQRRDFSTKFDDCCSTFVAARQVALGQRDELSKEGGGRHCTLVKIEASFSFCGSRGFRFFSTCATCSVTSTLISLPSELKRFLNVTFLNFVYWNVVSIFFFTVVFSLLSSCRVALVKMHKA